MSWKNPLLEIQASNSSLDQILRRVVSETGVKLEGLMQDQRVFGTYGPGPIREVLWELFNGSGYNVLMIGNRNDHVPLQVVLTVIPPAGPQAAASNADNEEADSPYAPPPAPPMVTPFGNGDSGKPETPDQVMRDILSRQHKIDQQQKNLQTESQQ